MSISRAEFARIMRRLGAECLHAEEDAGAWRWQGAVIEVRRMPPLRCGALMLPRLAVRVDLDALPPERARRLEERLQRAFQRGGG